MVWQGGNVPPTLIIWYSCDNKMQFLQKYARNLSKMNVKFNKFSWGKPPDSNWGGAYLPSCTRSSSNFKHFPVTPPPRRFYYTLLKRRTWRNPWSGVKVAGADSPSAAHQLIYIYGWNIAVCTDRYSLNKQLLAYQFICCIVVLCVVSLWRRDCYKTNSVVIAGLVFSCAFLHSLIPQQPPSFSSSQTICRE